MINFLDKILYIGVLAVVFLLPAYLVRFEIFNIPTTLLEVLIYLLFFTWLVSLFLDKEKITHLKALPGGNKTLLFGLFFLILGAFVSSVLSSDAMVSFGLFKAYFVDPLLFLVVFASVMSYEKIKYVIGVFVFSGAILSVVSSVYFLVGSITYDGRLQSIFNSPNFLAMSLAPAVLLLVWMLFFEFKYKKTNIFWFFVLLLVASPLLLTGSYSAFFGVSVASLLIVFLSKKSLKIKGASLFLFLILSISFLSFGAGGEKIQSFVLNNERSSLSSREVIWQASYEIIKDNYIFGIGPGMFQEYYLTYQERFKEPYLEWAVPYPHNVFLAFFVQLGILGFLGFLIVLFWVFKKSIHLILNSNKDTNKFSVFILSFFVYFVIHGLFDTPFWKNDLSLIFFLFLAILLISSKNKKSPQAS